ncbi:MAG: hypothetical protein ACYCYM_01855 [Saccharofermentanales bacterium]
MSDREWKTDGQDTGTRSGKGTDACCGVDATANQQYARELAEVLEYIQWRNFQKVIDRAILACKNSGFEVNNHFAEVSKMVEIGSSTYRKVMDYVMKSPLRKLQIIHIMRSLKKFEKR